MTSQIQFVSDAKGRPVSVIVPIQLWRELAAGEPAVTPAQKRAIDAEIARGFRSPHHGPFPVGEAVSFLVKELKARAVRRAKTTLQAGFATNC